MRVFAMAWRNVWRNKRRSWVTIAAMAFALCVELLYAGLLPGYLHSMEQDVLDLEVGDVQVHAAGYLDSPSIYTRIDGADDLLERLDAAHYAASPRLIGGGLAASGQLSAGVMLRGVHVERERSVSRLHEHITTGQWLDGADASGVVVGHMLAETLDVTPGAELVVLSQGADGSMANELYTVRGVLSPIAEGTDRALVLMPLDSLRELLVIDDGVHEIVVRRPGDVDLDTVAATVRAAAPELDVKTWREIMPVIASMLESTEGMVLIIFFVLYVAVAILILNALLMAVFERIREFGVLKALGVGPLTVVGLLFAESALQMVIAMALGIALALPGMWYLGEIGIDVGTLGGTSTMGVAMRQVWFGIYSLDTMLGPIVMLVFIVVLATLYPALKAAYLRPVQAMRHQ